MSQLSSVRPLAPVLYPESDGQPMGETDRHRDLLTDLIFALKWFLRGQRAYVAGNLFVYYEPGNPTAVVAPDVFVVRGVEQQQRRVFKVWEEGNHRPDVVIEITSRQTAKDDQEDKRKKYVQLGVPEYFLFDPYGEYLHPRLQGFRLVRGQYEAMEAAPLFSTVLGLELRVEGNVLRLYNPQTGMRLPTSDEEVEARRAAEARAAAEAAARQAAEARAAAEAEARAALEAELERLRKQIRE